MATPICRFRVSLSNWTGGPGLNTIYGSGDLTIPPDEFANEFALGLGSAYQDVQTYMVDGVTVQVEREVSVFDAVSGQLMDVVNVNPPDAIEGSGGQTITSRATAVRLHFHTTTIVKKRMLRGGIYFGPASASVMDANGQVPLAVQQLFRSAFQNLVSTGNQGLGVWHQPATDTSNDGVFGWARNVSVMPRPAVLRSRRD